MPRLPTKTVAQRGPWQTQDDVQQKVSVKWSESVYTEFVETSPDQLLKYVI